MVFNIKQNREFREKKYYRFINKKIQAYINNPIGDLDLYDLPISKLPNNLKYVDGDLCIRYTNISELPRELVINGSLCMSNTNISVLPDDIIINGDLFCHNTPLSKKYLKQELKKKYKIKGNIHGV